MSARPCACSHDRSSHHSEATLDPKTGSYVLVWVTCLVRGCECKAFEEPKKET